MTFQKTRTTPKVVSNLVFILIIRVRGPPCDVYSQDMRVRAEAGDMYTYPDVVAVCSGGSFEGPSPQSLTNPRAIFEVLSSSTQAFDRGKKFTRYRRLPSLVDYVLVASTGMFVEHQVRPEDDVWTRREHSLPNDVVTLESLRCALALAEIYERVNFPSLQDAP